MLVQQAVAERNVELAFDAYQETMKLPLTVTERELQEVEGYVLNGPWNNTQNGTLSICFYDH